jgi:hypothetical protein
MPWGEGRRQEGAPAAEADRGPPAPAPGRRHHQAFDAERERRDQHSARQVRARRRGGVHLGSGALAIHRQSRCDRGASLLPLLPGARGEPAACSGRQACVRLIAPGSPLGCLEHDDFRATWSAGALRPRRAKPAAASCWISWSESPSAPTMAAARRRGRVVRQRPAKPRTPVRIWSAPSECSPYSSEVTDQPDKREPAGPSYERTARELFPIGEMSPERYVALHGDRWGAGTIFTVRFADSEMDAWVRRAGELLFDWKERDALQREWLSHEEYEQVRKRAQSDGDL